MWDPEPEEEVCEIDPMEAAYYDAAEARGDRYRDEGF